MATNNNPDLLYLLPRESLLLFEDADLAGLLQAVANYYSPRNDQPSWGTFMRAVAQELARLDYMYQYDIVAREPQYLTPADARRRFAQPLSVGRSYPTAAQFDKGDFTGSPVLPALVNPVGYRDMLVDLIAAYGLGATVKAIADVVYAYTGKTVVVEELYKEVGRGIFDQSDRNAVRVSVNVGGDNPLTEIQNLQQLQEIVQSLYGAIDLAKPAHVGLEFTTVFGENENVSFSITDTLRIIIRQVENPPLDPMLWIAPIFDMKHPKTTLASWGRYLAPSITQAQWTALQAIPQVWSGSTAYKKGNLVTSPTVGYSMYRALKKSTGQDPDSQPSYWSLLPSPAAWQAYHLSPASGMYVLGVLPWTPSMVAYTGQLLVDLNGNLEVAAVGGQAGTSVTFDPVKGHVTSDGAISWMNLGLNYLTDPNKWLAIVSSNGVSTGEITNWNVNNQFGLIAPRELLAWEIKSDKSLTILNMD